MLTATQFTRNAMALGRAASQAYPKLTEAASSGLRSTTPEAIRKLQGSRRHFRDMTSLMIPGPLADYPISSYGLRALEKAGLSTQSLLECEDSYTHCLDKLNAASMARAASLHEQFRLSRDETIALALAFIQAGKKLGTNVDNAAMVSLMYNLLAPLPVEKGLLDRFETYAKSLATKLSEFPILSESLHWSEITPGERAGELESVFKELWTITTAAGIAPNGQLPVRLGFDRHYSTSALTGGFFVLPERRTQAQLQDGGDYLGEPAMITLAAKLIGSELRPFEVGYEQWVEHTDMAPAFVFALLSHEIFHASQYAKLDALAPGAKPTMRQWADATVYALSIGSQSVIATQNLASHRINPGMSESRVLIHLPHEKEAWALTFMVIKGLIQSVVVPQRYKPQLKKFITNNFDAFEQSFGLAQPPKSILKSGLLWQGDELLIRARTVDQKVKQEKIDQFLAQGMPEKTQLPGADLAHMIRA